MHYANLQLERVMQQSDSLHPSYIRAHPSRRRDRQPLRTAPEADMSRYVVIRQESAI